MYIASIYHVAKMANSMGGTEAHKCLFIFNLIFHHFDPIFISILFPFRSYFHFDPISILWAEHVILTAVSMATNMADKMFESFKGRFPS